MCVVLIIQEKSTSIMYRCLMAWPDFFLKLNCNVKSSLQCSNKNTFNTYVYLDRFFFLVCIHVTNTKKSHVTNFKCSLIIMYIAVPKGCFVPNLVSTGKVVLEKKSKCESLQTDGQTDWQTGRRKMAKMWSGELIM